MNGDDLLNLWRRDAATRCRRDERKAREAFKAMANKSTAYARAIEQFADDNARRCAEAIRLEQRTGSHR